jgi:hypothetical protein
LLFKYPEETPQGHFVDKAESLQGESIRIHLVSRDSKELYFEVTKYQDLPAQMEYHQYREKLERRFSELIITELKVMIWKSHPHPNILLNGSREHDQYFLLDATMQHIVFFTTRVRR